MKDVYNHQDIHDDALRTWPILEARKLLPIAQHKSLITFETGYGPSGLPHIGTFGEVVRTAMVRHAFSQLSDVPSRLLCFSDDMDGLRKVPDNIPNPDALVPFLNLPLTRVPDPFGQFQSFGEQNNHRLCQFLDNLGIDYTFMSATQCYRSGLFDQALLQILALHREILAVILPTLGPERQQSYSPFLPISPQTGRVLQVPILEYKEKTVVFRDEDGRLCEIPVTQGHCKLQWKVDWGMRWHVLGVDYEMAGKDLIDSVALSSQICKILGSPAPQGMIAEHFLDQAGGKISKSKGNGMSIEEWLRYGPVETLAYYMYNNPQRAKRLHFDVVPRHVDEYLQHLNHFASQTPQERLRNPLWSVHLGTPPQEVMPPLTFTLLLNLVSVCNGKDKEILWGFIQRMYPDISPKTHPFLDDLVGHAVSYYHDKVAPEKSYRKPSEKEAKALKELAHRLHSRASVPLSAEDIQTVAYAVGNEFFDDLKLWFSCFYEILLGQKSGPRVGSFIALHGLEETLQLIHQTIDQYHRDE